MIGTCLTQRLVGYVARSEVTKSCFYVDSKSLLDFEVIFKDSFMAAFSTLVSERLHGRAGGIYDEGGAF